MAATQLLNRNQQPSQDDIAEAISGNICRCTGYKKIFESVVMAYQEGES